MKAHKKVLALLLSAVMLIAILGGCTSGNSVQPPATEPEATEGEVPVTEGRQDEPSYIAIAAGNSGGTFYIIGAGQASILNDKLDIANFSVEATSTSIENLTYANNDSDYLGFCPLDYVLAAYNGDSAMDFTQKYENLRLMMVGHSTSVHFVVPANSSINSFEDMKGKTIAVPPSSSGYYVATRLLESYGISTNDVTLQLMATNEAKDAMNDGLVDVAVFSAGAPIAAVTELAMGKALRMISVPDDQYTKAFFENYPAYYSSTIPGGTYNGIDEDCVVVNFPISIVCNANLSDEYVYQIVKTICESTDELAGVHAQGAKWNKDNTMLYFEDSVIPFHNGAIKYFTGN